MAQVSPMMHVPFLVQVTMTFRIRGFVGNLRVTDHWQAADSRRHYASIVLGLTVLA